MKGKRRRDGEERLYLTLPRGGVNHAGLKLGCMFTGWLQGSISHGSLYLRNASSSNLPLT